MSIKISQEIKRFWESFVGSDQSLSHLKDFKFEDRRITLFNIDAFIKLSLLKLNNTLFY